MNKHFSEQGFFHVALITLVAVAALGFVIFKAFEANTNHAPASSQSPVMSGAAAPEKDIELQNIGIDTLSNVEITNQAVREFTSHGLKGFYVFGDKLGGKTDTRINPNFEYASLKPGTKAVAAIDGVVAFIKTQNETGDSEVFIQPKEGSAWTVGYDHITKLAVTKGDVVKAGDVLGEPTVQNNGLLRFEIQINKDANGTTTHYCPTVLLSATAQALIVAGLSSMQAAWETQTGLDLYDTSKQSPMGCLAKTMTSTQAEGLR